MPSDENQLPVQHSIVFAIFLIESELEERLDCVY